MADPSAFEAFTTRQDGIYAGFANDQTTIAEQGFRVDQNGTELQSGLLVAWRPPEQIAEEITEFSAELAQISRAFIYGYVPGEGMDNAHVTISDKNVVKGATRSLHDDNTTGQMIELIMPGVKRGIDAAGAAKGLMAATIRLDGVLHNGSVAIIPGEASRELFAVRSHIIKAVGDSGIDGFNGTWGSHSTVSRVLEERFFDAEETLELAQTLDRAPRFGEVRPAYIDVGFFNAGPGRGFDFTPVERFEVPSARHISMYGKST